MKTSFLLHRQVAVVIVVALSAFAGLGQERIPAALPTDPVAAIRCAFNRTASTLSVTATMAGNKHMIFDSL